MSKKHESKKTATTTSAVPLTQADPSAETSTKTPSKHFDLGDSERKQGFRGSEVDPTPNENYSVAGALAGKPTPETNLAHAAAVRETATQRDKLPADHPVQKHLQKVADAETAQGFRGVEVDDTPNSHYSVAGVTSGKPTPETSRTS